MVPQCPIIKNKNNYKIWKKHYRNTHTSEMKGAPPRDQIFVMGNPLLDISVDMEDDSIL